MEVRPIDANAFAKDLEMEASSIRVSWVCDRHEAAAIKSAFKRAAELARSFTTLDYAPVRHGGGFTTSMLAGTTLAAGCALNADMVSRSNQTSAPTAARRWTGKGA